MPVEWTVHSDGALYTVEEETGWRAGPLRHLIDVHPTPGLSNSRHHIYTTGQATHIGDPVDAYESARIEWVPLAGVRTLIENGVIPSATTAAALLYVLTGPAAGSQEEPGGPPAA
jgi:hypothetical protein